MSGFVLATSACFFCKQLFSYNPHRVPSTPPEWHPTREPVCAACMARINHMRTEAGVPPFPIYPDAYEPLPEAEL
jgi:hypothetical protein